MNDDNVAHYGQCSLLFISHSMPPPFFIYFLFFFICFLLLSFRDIVGVVARVCAWRPTAHDSILHVDRIRFATNEICNGAPAITPPYTPTKCNSGIFPERRRQSGAVVSSRLYELNCVYGRFVHAKHTRAAHKHTHTHIHFKIHSYMKRAPSLPLFIALLLCYSHYCPYCHHPPNDSQHCSCVSLKSLRAIECSENGPTVSFIHPRCRQN